MRLSGACFRCASFAKISRLSIIVKESIVTLLAALAVCGSSLRGWRYMLRRLLSYQRRRWLPRLHQPHEVLFSRKFGRAPDYDNPRTFNEKLGWMIRNDHDPRYVQLADKIAVRDYVRTRVGEEILIPLYGVWDKPSQIPFDELPKKFIMKCNHESGFVIICRDRDQLDRCFVRAQLTTHLRMNYYYRNLEWHYRVIRPRILAEELLEDDQGGEPLDYKIYCFDGVPRYLYAMKDRHSPHPTCSFYTSAWELLACSYDRYTQPTPFPRPRQLVRMLDVAAVLSQGLYFCRVDLYAVRNRVYFGEITIVPGAGIVVLSPESFDYAWGEQLVLPGLTK
jgi:hypothetical protein